MMLFNFKVNVDLIEFIVHLELQEAYRHVLKFLSYDEMPLCNTEGFTTRIPLWEIYFNNYSILSWE